MRTHQRYFSSTNFCMLIFQISASKPLLTVSTVVWFISSMYVQVVNVLGFLIEPFTAVLVWTLMDCQFWWHVRENLMLQCSMSLGCTLWLKRLPTSRTKERRVMFLCIMFCKRFAWWKVLITVPAVVLRCVWMDFAVSLEIVFSLELFVTNRAL